MLFPDKPSEFIKNQTFVAFDTETTGIWAPVNRIVEIGAVKFSLNREKAEHFETLVNPEKPIPEEVIKIHGITDTMVKDAPLAGEALQYFENFCGDDAIMIAHNAPFDISFIVCELERTSLSLKNRPVLDTVDIYNKIFPGLESYSLLSLASHFKLAESQRHRALDDALLVYELFKKAVGKFPEIQNLEELKEQFTSYDINDRFFAPSDLPVQFAELQKAIENNQKVRIDYRSSNQPAKNRIIKVNQIFQLGSKYYLNAFRANFPPGSNRAL